MSKALFEEIIQDIDNMSFAEYWNLFRKAAKMIEPYTEESNRDEK